jgi:6-phosphogluconolactonase
MMGTSVLVCPDAGCIALRAMDLLVSQLGAALTRRGEAHLALTGGSSAAALFRVLRSESRARRVDWARVHIWQGDERFVGPEHTDSNWGLALREWLEHPGGPAIPAERRHPIPVAEALAGGHDPAWAAARYARDLEALVPMRDGVPALDVILLGVGSDGHILSAFPASDALDADVGSVAAVPAPTHIGPHLPRVTLVPRLLVSAGLILLMVPGAPKRAVLADCFGEEWDPLRWPAQHAIRPNAVWLLDRDCAAGWLRGQSSV